MPTTREDVPVSSIVLNPRNFRHRPVDSHEEAYAALFATEAHRAQMLALATDIAARGLDPSSLMIVEPINGYWRVLEGNRRIAALKTMANPDLVPDDPDVPSRTMKTYRDKLGKVGALAKIPRTVLCVVTDDVELANHLIHLKHTGTGAHKGAGTELWDTEGRTRYELARSGSVDGKRPTASNRQSADALALLDALSVQFAGDAEMTALIERAKRRGLTTLGRLLIKAENQLRLGVQLEGHSVRFLVSRDALREGMIRVLGEVGTPNLNSRNTNTASDVVDYLNRTAPDLPTVADRLPQPERASAPPLTPTTMKPRRTKQLSVERRPYASLTLQHASTKTRAVLAEMKKLTIDDYPNVCAIMNRVLVDLFTADVYRALKLKPEESIGRRGKKCLELLDPAGTKPRQRRFPRLHDAYATNTGELSIDAMSNYVHREDYNAKAESVRLQCREYTPFLEALDEHVEQSLTQSDTP